VVGLPIAAATALFWVSLTLAVEGRTGPTEEPAASAFPQLMTDHADPPAGPVLSRASQPLPDRPSLLSPLYVSFATLQVLDIHSTLRASSFGAREGNPLVAVLLASPVAFVASKAAITTGLIYASEGLRKRHPRAAVLMMIGLNSAYALVVAHNYVTEARARTR
jgi:cation transport ATPase